ncbi:MAG TPA: glutathione S-transferase family protein [Sandaracinaceae bacterium LLY-WYZ-13_1]|nr:glutathione S-transferase family protein [Sandaracinaceae bacterium LLY-WYZ-13_1]
MAIELFGHPYSHNARKIHWALEEMGADYEYRTVDLLKGAQKQPEFMEMNPNGRVPVIHDGDLVLYESNAILWYLAEKNGKLLPSDSKDRALVLQWLAWQASDLAATCLDPFLLKFYASMGQPFDEAKHAELVKAAEAPLTVLNGHLEGRTAVVGDEMTVGDIAIAESIGLCDFAGIDLAPYAAIRAWFEPLSSREAFAKTRPEG